MRLQKRARLHEKVVQQIARDTLPRVQDQHTTRRREVAQRVSITLVDDLDGSEATETVQFGLDGTNYEIDLNEVHAKELRMQLEQFTVFARKVTTKKGRPGHRGNVRTESRAIREWAQGQGMKVSNRGVVPASIVQAYEAAH